MHVYDRILKGIIAALLLAITLLVVAQVFFRFVLSSPLPWPEELARLVFFYLVFVGGALASLHGDHISIEVVDSAVDEDGRSALFVSVARGLVVVAIMGVAVYGGVQVAPRAHRIALSGTGLPRSLMTMAVITGSALMGLDALVRVIGNVWRLTAAGRRRER
jgi:TRAP-type transport system small permease protein